MMDINQMFLQELGVKVANLEIENAQLRAQILVAQEKNEEPKETE